MTNRKPEVERPRSVNSGHPNYALIAQLFTLWIIGALCVKDIPISHVVAIAGEPTYLPCDISTNHEGDSVHLVLWYRDDLDTSVYSVDARGRNFELAERWSDITVFSKRANFLHDQQPAQLGVDQIGEGDAGIYRCRVDFQIGQTRNSRVNLTVIVPPKEVIITDNNGIGRNSVVGPYAEGDDLELICDVFGGKPQPIISWYRDSDLVTNETIHVNQGLSRSKIVVKNLGREDAGLILTCTAANNNRSIPLSSSVHVDMNFKPLQVKINGTNRPLSVGKRYNLICTSFGSRPPANITWWRDGQPLRSVRTSISNDGNTTTSILSLIANKMDAGKRLSCQAENPIMGISPITDEWLLEVQYKPEPRITLGKSLNETTIREGTDVYFDCKIMAEPPVYRVEWRHRGTALSHNVTQGIIISNQSLVLQRVDRKSAGNYTCVGHNSEGDGESAPFHLRVMFAPTCKPNQTNVHGVAKQEKANISCEVDANPSDVQFRWTFNNSAENIDVTADHIAQTGTTSIVSYTPMTELDYGTLLCWASNYIGRQHIPCVYHIIPAGHPDMVHNCTTSNTSTTSFSVRCSEGFNGGLRQAFLLEVRESNSQELRANMTSPVPRFSISHLDSGVLYQASVYAYNGKGRSEPMVVQAGTLGLPEKQLTSEAERPRHHVKLTPMLSVMIGVVAALVIVAVIVMVVLRIQNANPEDQGKPRLEDRDKSTKSVPIQRELRFLEGSNLSSEEKHPGSPFRKLDGAPEQSDADEKNPDIIPQRVNGDGVGGGSGPGGGGSEEPSEHPRKRRLVSTIDTSPSRNLLEHRAAPSLGGHGNYIGYCTIRSGIPLRELTGLSTKHKSVTSIAQSGKPASFQFQSMVSRAYGTGVSTLPRQHWPNQSVRSVTTITTSPQTGLRSSGSGQTDRGCPGSMILSRDSSTELSSRGHGQCCVQSRKDATTCTPLVMAKRESSV